MDKFAERQQTELDLTEDPDRGAALMKRLNKEIEASDKEKYEPSYEFNIGSVKINVASDSKELAVIYPDNTVAGLAFDPKTRHYLISEGHVAADLIKKIEKKILQPELWDKSA